ncbi:hypothetical protein JCM11754A_37490 [Isoptericola variabilis]
MLRMRRCGAGRGGEPGGQRQARREGGERRPERSFHGGALRRARVMVVAPTGRTDGVAGPAVEALRNPGERDAVLSTS